MNEIFKRKVETMSIMERAMASGMSYKEALKRLPEKELSDYFCGWDFVIDMLKAIRREKKVFNTYVVKDVKSGYYKIGKSSDVKRRVKAMSASNPNLKIVCVINKDIENSLHKKFKDKKIYSEWFALNMRDINYIKNL